MYEYPHVKIQRGRQSPFTSDVIQLLFTYVRVVYHFVKEPINDIPAPCRHDWIDYSELKHHSYNGEEVLP